MKNFGHLDAFGCAVMGRLPARLDDAADLGRLRSTGAQASNDHPRTPDRSTSRSSGSMIGSARRLHEGVWAFPQSRLSKWDRREQPERQGTRSAALKPPASSSSTRT